MQALLSKLSAHIQDKEFRDEINTVSRKMLSIMADLSFLPQMLPPQIRDMETRAYDSLGSMDGLEGGKDSSKVVLKNSGESVLKSRKKRAITKELHISRERLTMR